MLSPRVANQMIGLGLLETILWHGGEAQDARDQVVEIPAEARAALIAFLESL